MTLPPHETLHGEPVILGETKMGAIDYIRSFGGIVIDIMGHSAELEKRFPQPDKDMRSGLLPTQSHAALGLLALDARDYFAERSSQSTVDARYLRVGIRASFADYGVDSPAQSLYMAVIQPGHHTATLTAQALVRDGVGQFINKKPPVRVDDAQNEITRLLTNLAEYHEAMHRPHIVENPLTERELKASQALDSVAVHDTASEPVGFRVRDLPRPRWARKQR